jgi:hypothetical protein
VAAGLGRSTSERERSVSLHVQSPQH